MIDEEIRLADGKPAVITSDGKTVWVNNAVCCIGRFGLNGIDIHRPINEQRVQGECLFCTHEPVTAEDWETFKAKMKEFYGIPIPDHHKPVRFLTN